MGTGTCQRTPSTQQPPRGTPQLLHTGKGLLFPGETEAQVGWADARIAHPRSLKGTGRGMQAAQACVLLSHSAVVEGTGHSHAWAHLGTHSCECIRTLARHTHTCAPHASQQGQVTDLPPPWAISLTLSPSCHPPQNHSKITCTVPCGPPTSCPQLTRAGSVLCQRALPGELSLGGLRVRGAVPPCSTTQEPPHCSRCE